MTKIIRAVNQIAARAKMAELGLQSTAISADSWPQIKSNLGEFGVRLEQQFTVEIWSAMRGRGDTQYVFLGQFERPEAAPIAVAQFSPPSSGCKRCGR